MPGPWGAACRFYRESKGLSRKRVAARAKITATTYGRIERGHHTQTSLLQRIADVFEIPIENILQLPIATPARLIDTPIHHDVASGGVSVAEVTALREQLAVMQRQLATLLAAAEVRRRAETASQPVGSARDRKPRRPPHR